MHVSDIVYILVDNDTFVLLILLKFNSTWEILIALNLNIGTFFFISILEKTVSIIRELYLATSKENNEVLVINFQIEIKEKTKH